MKLFGNRRRAEHLGKKRLSGLQRGLIMLAVSLVFLGASVAALYVSFVRPMQLKDPVLPDTQHEDTFVPPTVVETKEELDEETGEVVMVQVERPASHKSNFYNILVVGTDDDGTRTDTIMIARLDTADHSVALLSIPRDTVITGNYSVPKINGVYGGAGKGEKGINALKSKLAQLLGFEVDAYAMVNLDAFIELVDLVGGVEFEVPVSMHYEDPTQDLYIHLDAGLQHLDGQKAMQLVRFRKGYATQDIERTHVQQRFLQALAKKCLEEVSIANIGSMAEIFLDNVSTDLSLGNIAYFGQELLKCDFENMYTYTLEGEAVMINDASCYAIYRGKTLDVVNAYFNPYDTELTAANVSIRTPEEIFAEQAAIRAQQEALEEQQKKQEQEEQGETSEDDTLFEDLPEENPEEDWGLEQLPDTELPTDDWITEEFVDVTAQTENVN
ncbi:MAG: LCP family protein [Oscillospiraceae bacterium]|nr:LCP family protein [Oscillospiraceae bacterium]